MVPASGVDQVVQRNAILVIAGQEGRGMAESLDEVLGIRRPRVAHLGREYHRLACPLEMGHHASVGEILIKGELHAPGTPSAGAQGGVSSPRWRMLVRTSSRSYCMTSAWRRP